MSGHKGVPTVIVMGLGNLGCRYLEGLAKADMHLEVWGVDPNPEARTRAREALLNRTQTSSTVDFRIEAGLHDVPRKVDLLISSTTARHRLESLTSALTSLRVDSLLLEKIVAPSLTEFDEILELAQLVPRTWVNHPRRISPDWNFLREKVGRDAAVSVLVSGRNWGLSTSALHFVDLVCWLTGEQVAGDFEIPAPLVWRKSRRPGFNECQGSIEVRFDRRSYLALSDDSVTSVEPQHCKLHLSVPSLGFQLEIEEYEGDSPREDDSQSPHLVRLPRLSEYAFPLVQDILTSGRCGLPSLESTVPGNQAFLKALSRDAFGDTDPGRRLPIT